MLVHVFYNYCILKNQDQKISNNCFYTHLIILKMNNFNNHNLYKNYLNNIKLLKNKHENRKPSSKLFFDNYCIALHF